MNNFLKGAGVVGLLWIISTSLSQTVDREPSYEPEFDRYFSLDQLEFLDSIVMVDSPDGMGGVNRTAQVVGLNLQIVNGTGDTETANGVGNLIVGYQEDNVQQRTGSHNIVGGNGMNYTQYGSLAVSKDSDATGEYCVVIGGQMNESMGDMASVIGGQNNFAVSDYSMIAGGQDNVTINGIINSIIGGRYGLANGTYSTIVGGDSRQTFGRSDIRVGNILQDN